MSADYDEADVEAAAAAIYPRGHHARCVAPASECDCYYQQYTDEARRALAAAAPSITTRARAQAGEDAARVIEAERASLIDGHNKFAHATIAHYADGLNCAARIARDTTKAGA